jgi:hypothetical protein
MPFLIWSYKISFLTICAETLNTEVERNARGACLDPDYGVNKETKKKSRLSTGGCELLPKKKGTAEVSCPLLLRPTK